MSDNKSVQMSSFRRIFKRYSFFFVGVPILVVIHLAWFRLQENELFVPKDQKAVLGSKMVEFKRRLRKKFFFDEKTDEKIVSE